MDVWIYDEGVSKHQTYQQIIKGMHPVVFCEMYRCLGREVLLKRGPQASMSSCKRAHTQAFLLDFWYMQAASLRLQHAYLSKESQLAITRLLSTDHLCLCKPTRSAPRSTCVSKHRVRRSSQEFAANMLGSLRLPFLYFLADLSDGGPQPSEALRKNWQWHYHQGQLLLGYKVFAMQWLALHSAVTGTANMPAATIAIKLCPLNYLRSSKLLKDLA